MECVETAPLDVSRVVALETGRVENEPRGAEFEDAVPVAAVAEHLTALPLGEDTVLLALVGLAGRVTEGGGEGDLDEKGDHQKHCVLLECGSSCKAPA